MNGSDGRSRRGHSGRLATLAAALLVLLAIGQASASAATITIEPANPNPGGNFFPFGSGQVWPPFAAFIYKNIPAFELKAGDTLAFDTMTTNGGDVQIDIDLARTTTNGGEIAAQPFTRVAVNTQTPDNATGDTVVGNFELRFTSIAPFSFPGGGLIIRFSNPSPTYAADPVGGGNITGASSTDPSGFFVRRAYSDPDGVAPWNGDFVFIGGFRVTTAEAPPQAARCQGKQVTISGSDGAQTLRGTQHADVINGLGGKDKIIARGGNDIVCGGAGNDNISGGAGKDMMNGETGKDLLRGGKGKDLLRGGKGKDLLRGGKGKDLLRGGKGKDTAKGGPGRDTLVGGPKHDVCIGGSGRDVTKSC